MYVRQRKSGEDLVRGKNLSATFSSERGPASPIVDHFLSDRRAKTPRERGLDPPFEKRYSISIVRQYKVFTRVERRKDHPATAVLSSETSVRESSVSVEIDVLIATRFIPDAS